MHIRTFFSAASLVYGVLVVMMLSCLYVYGVRSLSATTTQLLYNRTPLVREIKWSELSRLCF